MNNLHLGNVDTSAPDLVFLFLLCKHMGKLFLRFFQHLFKNCLFLYFQQYLSFCMFRLEKLTYLLYWHNCHQPIMLFGAIFVTHTIGVSYTRGLYLASAKNYSSKLLLPSVSLLVAASLSVSIGKIDLGPRNLGLWEFIVKIEPASWCYNC